MDKHKGFGAHQMQKKIKKLDNISNLKAWLKADLRTFTASIYDTLRFLSVLPEDSPFQSNAL